MPENPTDQTETNEIIPRQEAFISGLFPRMSPRTITEVRTKLHEWCVRDSQDYFFDEGRVKNAAHEVLAQRRVPQSTPRMGSIPHEWRNRLAHTMGRGDILDKMVKNPEYPPSYLGSALKIFEKEHGRKPVVGSIGYGGGLLEKWLLDKGLVPEVRGVEFQEGPEAHAALEKFIEEIYTQGLAPHVAAGRLPERFSDFVKKALCQYLTQGGSLLIGLGGSPDLIAAICPMPFVVLRDFQEREEASWSYIEQMRQSALSYRQEMDFIRGDSHASDHPRFKKGVISTENKSTEVLVNSMFDQMGDGVDIFLFQDSLHHHPDPVACVKEAFRRLKPGGLIAIAEPFYIQKLIMTAFSLTLAFETTFYPDSIFSLEYHMLWIDYMVSKGANVVFAESSQAVFESDFKMDPFHRMQVVLEKPKNYNPSSFAGMDESIEDFVKRISR